MSGVDISFRGGAGEALSRLLGVSVRKLLGVLKNLRGQVDGLGVDIPFVDNAFDQVIELDPDNAGALNNAAFVYAEQLGDPSKALGLANRASELRPDDPSILDTLGWVRYHLQQFDEAEDALRRSLTRRESAETMYHLASVLFKQDRLDTAQTYVNRAIELRPDPQTRAEIERLEDDIRRAQNRK